MTENSTVVLNSESEYISGCATCMEFSSGDDFLGLPLSNTLQERCYRVRWLVLQEGNPCSCRLVLVRLYVRTRRPSPRASNSLPWAALRVTAVVPNPLNHAKRFCYCEGPGFTTRALSSAVHQHRSTGIRRRATSLL